ncbi:hypothetical protein M9978_16605 [Sphingomonas sp. MG17]|uniref:Uncharacterized protein n=1 Tax=Sphingomonas tagetis TaxID=2949092 RepID=A0A9X2HKZ8_9SPHN|nr:hypothetical protein [Sphingomonas tagetis]MCP3732047.1 hypothetical protein [Sphingomonas tagetis]
MSHLPGQGAIAKRILTARDEREGGFRIFPAIPPRFGVIAVKYSSTMFRAGEVAVYDELWTSGKPQDEPLVEDGGVYVIQYQRPTAAMTWDMWWAGRAGYCPSLLDVQYELVVASRSSMPGREDKWQTRPLRDARPGVFICTDGPLDEIQLTNKIVGKVVGIYNPAAFEGSAK